MSRSYDFFRGKNDISLVVLFIIWRPDVVDIAVFISLFSEKKASFTIFVN